METRKKPRFLAGAGRQKQRRRPKRAAAGNKTGLWRVAVCLIHNLIIQRIFDQFHIVPETHFLEHP